MKCLFSSVQRLLEIAVQTKGNEKNFAVCFKLKICYWDYFQIVLKIDFIHRHQSLIFFLYGQSSHTKATYHKKCTIHHKALPQSAFMLLRAVYHQIKPLLNLSRNTLVIRIAPRLT